VSQNSSSSAKPLFHGGVPLSFVVVVVDKAQAVVLIQSTNIFSLLSSTIFKSEFCILLTKMFHNIFKIVHAHLLTLAHFISLHEREKFQP